MLPMGDFIQSNRLNQIQTYIDSGILELFVMGAVSEEEGKEVEAMAAQHAEIRNEIEQISLAMEQFAEAHAKTPDPNAKPLLLATIDYTERLKAGEVPTVAPFLSPDSKVIDFEPWTSREDMVAPDDFDEIFVKIIGFTPEETTAIVWIENMAPYEVHTDTYEKFLILEGTCDIDIDGEVHSLKQGDFLSIPLFKGHTVRVTSDIPCKVLLQRTAA